MTLIVFYTNDTYSLVAADRRLTRPDLTIYESDRTKLLTWYQGLVFGFTGQAFFMQAGQRVSAIDWLANQLSAQEQDTGGVDFNTITERLDHLRFPLGARILALGGAGFLQGVPTRLLVTNIHGTRGERLDEPTSDFRLVWTQAEGENLFTLGGKLSPGALNLLQARVPQVRSNPKALAQLLAGAIEMSTDKTIGEDVLVTTMHRDAATHPSILSDVVVPELSGRSGVTIPFAMPTAVLPGGTIINVPPQPMRRGRS